MSHEYLDKKRVVAASSDDLSGTGVSLNFYTPVPIDIYRWGYIITVALDATTDLVAGLNIQTPEATDVPYQTATFTANAAAGSVLSVNVINPAAQTTGEDALGGATVQTSLIDAAPEGPIRVPAGSQVEIEITTGATSGTGYGWIEFVEFDMPNVDIATTAAELAINFVPYTGVAA